MFTQTLLPGFDFPQYGNRQRLNLFLALIPPPRANEQVDRLAGKLRGYHGLDGNPLGSSLYHVSVHKLVTCFELAEETVPAIETIVGPVAAATRPFEIQFDRALSFTRRAATKAFVLRGSRFNGPLMELYRKIGALLPWRTAPVFTPHVTMLYDERLIGEHAVGPVNWEVSELVLVCSLVGLGQHKRLARWKLGGGGGKWAMGDGQWAMGEKLLRSRWWLPSLAGDC